MVNALLNLAIQIGFFVLVVWLVLALLGLKWHLFRTVRQGVQQTTQNYGGGNCHLAVGTKYAKARRRILGPGQQRVQGEKRGG